MNNRSIEFVYFDVGGVLLNFEQAFVELGKRANKPAALAKEAHYEMDLAACVDKIDVETYWKRFQEHMGAVIEIPLRIDLFFVDYFFPIKEMHMLAREVKKRMGVGLLTNMWGEMYPLIKERGLIPPIEYDAEVVSNQLKLHKPQPEIYEVAEKLADVADKRILFIDDSKTNVEAAISYGWKGFVFDTHNPADSVQKLRDMLL